MKTKVLIVAINYNSYDELYQYLSSVDIAAEYAINNVDVEFIIVDNTPHNWQSITETSNTIHVRAFPYHQNLGYMGGATRALVDIGEEIVKSFDYVIISNVDIKLSKNFFTELHSVRDTTIGWVVPSIFREKDNSNENPFMLVRPQKIRLLLLKYIYGRPFLYKLMYEYSQTKRKLKLKFKRNKTITSTLSRNIYAGMGSIIILSKKLVNKHYPFIFPAFMYGEELFFAELVRKEGLTTRFFPKIVVYDKSGVSTGLLNLKVKCKMMEQGISKIIDIFF